MFFGVLLTILLRNFGPCVPLIVLIIFASLMVSRQGGREAIINWEINQNSRPQAWPLPYPPCIFKMFDMLLVLFWRLKCTSMSLKRARQRGRGGAMQGEPL